MFDTEIDNFFMKRALIQADIAKSKHEVPVGAIIVFNNRIIAESYNNPIESLDPTAHAEINVLRKATQVLENYRLTGANLYVTLEPCAMCYGAIVHSRISKLIFGAYDPKTGVCGSTYNLHEQACFNHRPYITGGVLEEECSSILKDFFKERRN